MPVTWSWERAAPVEALTPADRTEVLAEIRALHADLAAGRAGSNPDREPVSCPDRRRLGDCAPRAVRDRPGWARAYRNAGLGPALVCWLALPVSVLTAQVPGDSITVLPGDTLLDPERLVPHRVTWRVTVADSNGGSTVQGLWTDTWVRSTDAGQPVFVFHQLFADTTGAVLYSAETVFDATTFRAIRSTQEVPPGFRVTYRSAGDTVSGTVRSSAAAAPREFQVVFSAPVWDPLAPVTLLLPLERLEPGTLVRYPVWDQRPGVADDVTWSEMRVDSLGTIEIAEGRTAKVWHVTFTPLTSVPSTVFRLSRAPTPPYAPWFVVERPTLVREWTLVDWQPLTRPVNR